MFTYARQPVFDEGLSDLQRAWAATSDRVQLIRDYPDCAEQEYAALLDSDDPGIRPGLSFDADENAAAAMIASGARPSVAILREQGVIGQVEMAAAFNAAGFSCHDVHMSDVIEGRTDLSGFSGLTSDDGRFTIMMPHPERVFRTVQNSWHPDEWGEYGRLDRDDGRVN